MVVHVSVAVLLCPVVVWCLNPLLRCLWCRNAPDAVLHAAVVDALALTHVHPLGIDGAYVMVGAAAGASWCFAGCMGPMLAGFTSMPCVSLAVAVEACSSNWQAYFSVTCLFFPLCYILSYIYI